MNLYNKNFFSIIIPLYNREDLITETLKSISEQTYKNFEVIIIDDGSTDKSAQVALEAMSEFSLKGEILHIKNSGHGAARDYGIQHSSGNILSPIDSDDLWLPSFLEDMNRAIIELETEVDNCIFFSDFIYFFDDKPIEKNKFESLSLFPQISKTRISDDIVQISDDFFRYLLQEQPIFWGAVCFSRSMYNRLGAVSKYIPGKSGSPVEWEFFLRISFNGVIGIYVNKTNTKIRRHINNMSKDLTTQFEGELEILRMLPDVLALESEHLILVNQEINDRTFSCGYQYFSQYKMRDARRCFFSTLYSRHWKRSLFYVFLSTIPICLLRKIRDV